MNRNTCKKMAAAYRRRFGFSLKGRLRVLSHRYPDVDGSENFIYWEGYGITKADTTQKIRALLSQLTYAD